MSHTSSAPTIVFGSAPRNNGVRPHHHHHYSSPQSESYPHSPSQPAHHSNLSNARPMAIPNAREQPPPPLPPPRYIGSLDHGEDPGWRYGNSRQHDIGANGHGNFAMVKPGSSLLGGGQSDQEHAGHGDRHGSRRGSSMSTSATMSSNLIDPEMRDADVLEHSDDDRNSLSRPGRSDFRYVGTTSCWGLELCFVEARLGAMFARIQCGPTLRQPFYPTSYDTEVLASTGSEAARIFWYSRFKKIEVPRLDSLKILATWTRMHIIDYHYVERIWVQNALILALDWHLLQIDWVWPVPF
jgi:hypothetical protein